MAQRGLKDRDMAALIGGCQESAVRKWRAGARIPRRESLMRILEVTAGAVRPEDFFLQQGDAA